MKKVFTVGLSVLFLFTINSVQATTVDHVYNVTYPEKIKKPIIHEQLGKYMRDVYPQLPKKREEELEKYITKFSKKRDVDPFLVASFVGIECDFVNQKSEIWHKKPIYNDNGKIIEYELVQENSCGYFQMNPDTFERIMGYSTTCEQLKLDVKEAVRAGVKYVANKVLEKGANGIGEYNSGPDDGKWNFGYMYKVIGEYKRVRHEYKPSV